MYWLAALFFLIFSLPAFCGQLTLTIIQFPEVKTVEQLDVALRGVSLVDLTNSNRTMTKVSYLKDGYVLFAQSGPALSHFKSATRLSNVRADVDGSLENGKMEVSIALSEGVAAGLRSFSRRVFQGSGTLRAGQPHVVCLRAISEKSRQVTRGNVKIQETPYCTAITAQLIE